MPFLLLLKGRGFLLRDKKKLFKGIKIKKTFFWRLSGVFLLVCLESGLYARRNLPDYSHFATCKVAVLDADEKLKKKGSGHGVRICISADEARADTHVGASEEFELRLRHAVPKLRLLAFCASGHLLWSHEDFVGYCQVPLELLAPGQTYEGNLVLYNPLSHKASGTVRVRLIYSPDRTKTRLSLIAPRQEVEEKGGVPNQPTAESISKSIDLMELLTHAQSVAGQLDVVRHFFQTWFGWDCVPCSMTLGCTLGMMCWRPQYAGMWFNTLLSTVMLAQGARHYWPEVEAKILSSSFPNKSASSNLMSIQSDAFADEHSGHQKSAASSKVEVSQSKWLLLRAAEYSGLLKPIGPIMLGLDAVLAELHRIAIWESAPKSAALTCASLGFGVYSTFIRIPKMRITAWFAGTLSVWVLATAPWMSSIHSLGGTVGYLGDKLHLGRFPQITKLEQVGELRPWDAKLTDPGTWKRILAASPQSVE
eukprot:NODE_4729_length_1854_cov_9.048060.p1 GENE.NODE_4729_length_1854_cov_9.048060~~NODE_4729_length_1854_cov_9.048060.p1  ORF type:complete len:525 (-),score=97.94 NODE_4729_length_1854_cov_9.048060:278-1714(-)